MQNIKQMLESRGLETDGVKIKIARHVIKKSPDAIKEYVAHPATMETAAKHLAQWQRVQEVNSIGMHFRGCHYVVSCCYLPNNLALFAGVFCNKSRDRNPVPLNIKRHLPARLGQIYRTRIDQPDRYFFNLIRDGRFNGLEGRVIVEWGNCPRMWVQNFYPNAPKRILPPLKNPRRIFDEGYGS